MNADCFGPVACRCALALALFGASAAAPAQTIYKCSGGDGPVAFQQTPCARAQQSQRIDLVLPAAPVAAPAPAAPKPKARTPRTTTRRAPAARELQSFECRSAEGALFYRHSACPSSIPRRGRSAERGDGNSDRVRGTPIPRSDACRRMRSPGRDGREHDDNVSTYDRNLGRDPCRRH